MRVTEINIVLRPRLYYNRKEGIIKEVKNIVPIYAGKNKNNKTNRNSGRKPLLPP
jgi:hypothetical protein